LPLIATAMVARLGDAVRRTAHGGRKPGGTICARTTGCTTTCPPTCFLAGRVTSLLAGLGIVVLAGRLARRLAGPRAGLAAALLTAVGAAW